MAKRRFDRLSDTDQKALRWFINSRFLPKDQSGMTSKSLVANRDELYEREGMRIIARWHDDTCLLELPSHEAGSALAEELGRWSIPYLVMAPEPEEVEG